MGRRVINKQNDSRVKPISLSNEIDPRKQKSKINCHILKRISTYTFATEMRRAYIAITCDYCKFKYKSIDNVY